MRLLALSFFLIFLSLSNRSLAEYRVFLLKIESTKAPAPPDPNQKSESSPPSVPDYRLVESTLDPEQYRGYYPLSPDEKITYIATWRCRGRTDDFKPYCPNPKQAAPAKDQIQQPPS